MKTYKIHWAIEDTGTEYIDAENQDEAIEIFNDYPLTDLLGHVGNIAKVLRITEVQYEDNN